jgi:hypothetical protein
MLRALENDPYPLPALSLGHPSFISAKLSESVISAELKYPISFGVQAHECAAVAAEGFPCPAVRQK